MTESLSALVSVATVVVAGILLKRAQSVDIAVNVKDLLDRVRELEILTGQYELDIERYRYLEREHERIAAKRDAELAELKARVQLLESVLAQHGIDPV